MIMKDRLDDVPVTPSRGRGPFVPSRLRAVAAVVVP
jgi:hypothetical protein